MHIVLDKLALSVGVFGICCAISQDAVGSESAILDAIRKGKINPGSEIVVPKKVDAAPVPGAASRPANQWNNLTKREEKLIVDKLFPLSAAKWLFNRVFVCWENPTSNNSDGRRWTQDAVAQTWEKHSAIKFLGWNKCGPETLGIRILIAEDGPHVKELGKFLNGVKNGMVLNFTFESWSSEYCKPRKEFCIRALAVHEFGHAIGIAHEQNRPDAPGECALLRQGTDGDVLDLTPYDKTSVMNYCAPEWNNDGNLSELDIKGVQAFYGPSK